MTSPVQQETPKDDFDGFALLRERAPNLPKRLRQAADYALANPDDMALSTAARVAQQVSVQASPWSASPRRSRRPLARRDHAFEDGDVVLVPKGYHPVGAPHGYELHCLNVMAGPKRSWKFHNGPAHEWMLKA